MTKAITAATDKPAKRHKLLTRTWHWVNLVSITIMMMSGMMIFNAHPNLYWGTSGNRNDTPWLTIDATASQGYLQVSGSRIPTTGVLGRYTEFDGTERTRAFPSWITIPSSYDLADARLWHFFFAWFFAFGLLIYMIGGLFNRHIVRDLHIHRTEWRPSHIWQDIKDHAVLKFRQEPVGSPYNFLQKAAYVSVLFILLPLMILTGMSMSPSLNSSFGFLLDLFGGRQSARSIHFIVMIFLIGFFLLHISLVILNRPVKHIASMITGGNIPEPHAPAPDVKAEEIPA